MSIKLRKINKLNIVVAVVMCAVLLFCFCSSLFDVQAADDEKYGDIVLGADYKKFVTFKGDLAKSGYLTYYPHSGRSWNYSSKYVVNTDLKVSDLVDKDIPYYGNPSATYYLNARFKEFLKYAKLDVSDLTVYCVFGGKYEVYSDDTRMPLLYYFIVPKESKVCISRDVSDDPSYDMWCQRAFYFMTDSDSAFFVNFEDGLNGDSVNYKDSCYYANGANYDNVNKFYRDDESNYLTIKVDTPNYKSGSPVSAPFTFTNCPVINNDSNCLGDLASFIRDGSVTPINANSDYKDSDKKEYPAESFYWDSMTCKPSVVGVSDSENKSKYCFAFNYTYSCPLMVDPTEMFSCEIVYSSDIRYQDGKGRMYSMTDTQKDTFSLNKHKSGYSNDSLYLQSNFGYSPQALYVTDALSYLANIFPYARGDTNLAKYSDCIVKSAKIYVTVFLYHVPDPDTLFSNSDIMQSAKDNTIMSTDVRSFSFDLFNLKEDTEGAVVKPTVITEDVTDDDGNVVNKKVTDVVASDDSGKIIINITIDNSNKVEDKNNNVNIPSGSGSSDDDDDKNTKSFWKYVTGIVAFFTALLNSDSGLFAVIASYFKFIPADFWSVTIGAIVVIAILSIYRLAKKGG